MKPLVVVLTAIQVLLSARVFARMVATAHGTLVGRVSTPVGSSDRITVLVPVLNEAARIEPCLAGLISQGEEVAEILVIDGGSADGTQDLIRQWTGRDPRIRLIDAAPVPDGVNGKSFGLQAGLVHSCPTNRWVLTIDADVRPDPLLARSLLAHAAAEAVYALSIATIQRLSGLAEGLLHPAMLTTLVYRFGIPGHATDRAEGVQANGQCFFVRRDHLDMVGQFTAVFDSVCEDVTLARALAESGVKVGFYESDRLVEVEMYSGWRDAWKNWTRSLPMRDHFSGPGDGVGLSQVLFVQAFPLWLVPIMWRLMGRKHPVTMFNIGLLCARFGTLVGTARAYYDPRPWSYWFSPISDLPVALRLIVMSRRQTHTWRGRTFTSRRAA
jgi:dolichol-phosphate mannosyltransferase